MGLTAYERHKLLQQTIVLQLSVSTYTCAVQLRFGRWSAVAHLEVPYLERLSAVTLM